MAAPWRGAYNRAMISPEAGLLIAVLILVAFQLAPWRWSRRRKADAEIAYVYVIEERRP